MKIKSINNCVTVEEERFVFPVKEKGKTFLLEHKERIVFFCKVVDIDKCCFKDSESRRCDYLFVVPKKKQPRNVNFSQSLAFYVELKGDSIESACEQLFHGIDKTKFEISDCAIRAKVIGTKGFYPAISTSEYYRKVRKLIKREIEFEKVGKKNNFTYSQKI